MKKVCFNINIETAILVKIFKNQTDNKELDSIVNSFLNKELTTKLHKMGINLKYENKNFCPKCNNGKLTQRNSQAGKFLGCSNYPKCKFTKSII